MEVEPHDLVECLERQLEERTLADCRRGDVATGRVDEDVDLAPAFAHRRARTIELRHVEHVRLEGHRLIAEALSEVVERLAPSGKEADPRARRGEAARDRSAEDA